MIPARIMYAKVFIFGALLTLSCKSSKEFTGFNYDPPDVTNTVSKQVELQPKRVIGTGTPKVWVSNEFKGARLSDFIQISDHLFQVNISPELAPINNSPWYAFKIWSDEPQNIELILNYKEARHRYHPKISHDGTKWSLMDSALISVDTTTGNTTFSLAISQDTTWISAQELETTTHFEEWLTQLAQKPFIDIKDIGYSHFGAPIKEVQINHIHQDSSKKVLLVLGRQHPPEIPGFKTTLYFLEELAGSQEIAIEFRKKYVVLAYPMMNPDGSDNGHWRYNAGGVDLNRDWVNFNQPETRAVRDAVNTFMKDPSTDLIYGVDFHSTDENIFYPILPELPRPKGDITYPWINDIKSAFPNTLMVIEAFDTSSPISKNWIYKTFGADALTYEVNDSIKRDDLEKIARYAARSLMKKLLKNDGKKTN